jgi:hypothetical protein
VHSQAKQTDRRRKRRNEDVLPSVEYAIEVSRSKEPFPPCEEARPDHTNVSTPTLYTGHVYCICFPRLDEVQGQRTREDALNGFLLFGTPCLTRIRVLKTVGAVVGRSNYRARGSTFAMAERSICISDTERTATRLAYPRIDISSYESGLTPTAPTGGRDGEFPPKIAPTSGGLGLDDDMPGQGRSRHNALALAVRVGMRDTYRSGRA